jgi:hypothetical protein
MDYVDVNKSKPLYKGAQIVWYILYVIEVLLAFRFALRLLGANPGAGFTEFIYTLSYPFVVPFLTVFRQSRLIEGSVFEWSTLLAMFAYWVLAAIIVRLFVVSKPVSGVEANAKLDKEI